MSEYLSASIKTSTKKDVDENGVVTYLKKGFGIDLELKLDPDDPIESKLRLVNEGFECLKEFKSRLEEEAYE